MFATLAQLANVLAISSQDLPDIAITAVQTDSRLVEDGNLFIALVGDRFNGHNYIKQAQKNGATVVLCSQAISENIPCLHVANTRLAFGKIAAWARQHYQPIVLGITGSNGKTSTKNMLGSIMSCAGNTLTTYGNLNNDLGVPMTLCGLRTHHKYCVMEMGANHVGEIAYLSSLVRPDIALITNAEDAHIGEFISLENLVAEKGEIYKHLTKQGVAIINNDSEHKTTWLGYLSGQKYYLFGESGTVWADDIVLQLDKSTFTLCYQDQKIAVVLNFIGKHQISNALAASACAIAAGVLLPVIAQGLSKAKPEAGRVISTIIDNMRVIDDTYNANPASMRAAIQVLANHPGQTVLVLGGMVELGEQSQQKHQAIVAYAKQHKIDFIYSFGVLGKAYGVENFEIVKDLCQQLTHHHASTTILIKGSRVVKMEKIVAELSKK